MTDQVTLKQRPKTIAGIKITPAKELVSTEWGMCIALYGSPGVGKTTTAGKLAYSPYASPVLFLDEEGGTHVIKHIPNVDIAAIGNWAELSRVSGEITRLGSNCPYKTIVIDNMTEVQAMNLKAVAGTGTPQIQHYNQSTAELLHFTRQWRDFARFNGINVVFIAWTSPEEDNSSGIKIIKQDVGFTPSLARQFPGIVDIVGFLSVEGSQGVRVLSFAPSNRTAAKFRRAADDVSMKIPLTIKFNDRMSPLEDIIGTLKGGLPWPSEKYQLKSQEEKRE